MRTLRFRAKKETWHFEVRKASRIFSLHQFFIRLKINSRLLEIRSGPRSPSLTGRSKSESAKALILRKFRRGIAKIKGLFSQKSSYGERRRKIRRRRRCVIPWAVVIAAVLAFSGILQMAGKFNRKPSPSAVRQFVE
ncbi:hypothetical protein M569_16050, partial [Genlisea aurea]